MNSNEEFYSQTERLEAAYNHFQQHQTLEDRGGWEEVVWKRLYKHLDYPGITIDFSLVECGFATSPHARMVWGGIVVRYPHSDIV